MTKHSAIRTGTVKVNDVDLYYEDRGSEQNPALIMVNGMGAQLIYWPEALCEQLSQSGYRVIRFDNRDCGLSGDTAYNGRFSVPAAYLNYRLRRPAEAAYDLHTMASDAIGILDALNIKQAHWAGFSMGGMIVQLAAASYPERVLSLVSFMSTPNEPDLPGPSLKILLSLLMPVANNREAAIKARVSFTKMIGSPGYKRSTEDHLRNARENIDRAFRPKAGLLHKLAVMATGGFAHKLEKVQVPALIVHGEADPLVRPEGGKASAAALPNASLKLIKGMGHNFPDELVPHFTQMMLEHLNNAEAVMPNAA